MAEQDTRPTMDELLKQLSKAEKATLTRADTAFEEITEGKTLEVWLPLLAACVIGLRLANIRAGTDDRQSDLHVRAFNAFMNSRYPGTYAKASKNDVKHAKWFAMDDTRRDRLDEFRKDPSFNLKVHTLSGARRRVEAALKAQHGDGDGGEPLKPGAAEHNSSKFSLMHELGHVMTLPQAAKRIEAMNDKLERLQLHGDILSEDAERVEGYFDRLQRDMGWDEPHLAHWKREVLFELLTDDDIVWMYEQRQPRRRRNGGKKATPRTSEE